MKVSKRIEAICNLVKSAHTVADIGCDHCFTLIHLVNNNKIEYGIGCDINKEPLKRGIENIKKHGMLSTIETRLGYGLSTLRQYEAGAIIMSGMGGLLIIDILSKNLDLVKTFDQIVLSPQSHLYELRKFLHKSNCKIENEIMIYDDKKYYNILSAVNGNEQYTDFEYLFGRMLLKNKDSVFKSFINEEIEKNRRLLQALSSIDNPNISSKADEVEQNIKNFEEALNCLL